MSTPKIEYIILAHWDSGDLAAKVRDHIIDGWRPLGGVCLSQGVSNTYYAQAMTRELPGAQLVPAHDTEAEAVAMNAYLRALHPGMDFHVKDAVVAAYKAGARDQRKGVSP